MLKNEDTSREKETEQRDLESGDNPEERERLGRGKIKKSMEDDNVQHDLESGDNPEERERTSK